MIGLGDAARPGDSVSASASGLRPAAAFVLVAAVLLAVAVTVAGHALGGGDALAGRVRREEQPEPAYAIEDRAGRPLAVFLKRFELSMSPQAAWHAHTPERIAAGVSRALGGAVEPAALAARMLPDAEQGWIEVERTLDVAQATRVVAWIRESGVPGIGVIPLDSTRLTWALRWQPAVVLSAETRERVEATSPALWCRRIEDHLVEALFPAEVAAARDDGRYGDPWRALVWNELMPSRYCVVARDLAPESAWNLEQLLRAEGVHAAQIELSTARERAYPQGPFPVLGTWGWTDPEASAPQPAAGLELLCDALLADPAFAWIEEQPESYSYLNNKAARKPTRPYYLESQAESDVPVVRTTLDARLMAAVRALLAEAQQKHQAAAAMAIAVDLASGEVLAVDGVSPYPHATFLPLHYAYTPGSTFKLVTMAIALEAGTVTPERTFDVGNGEACVVSDGKSRRTIHEAEHTKAVGRISAAQCLAYSSNAGMAQVGLTVDSSVFQAALGALHYGEAPQLGLGPESPGMLTTPERWSRIHTQASVSFGHEIQVTLWQHATAVAALLRGGWWQPLTLLTSVEQRGRREALEPSAGAQVVSAETSAELRAMMALGASEGTGRSLCERVADLALATKTGTAEKVAGEICAHSYGQALARVASSGRNLTQAEYAAAKSAPAHAGSCYTSSIVVLARAAGAADAPDPDGGASAADAGRDVLVYVVIDEPRKGGYFGSSTAGPVALAIAREACGTTVDGAPRYEPALGLFAPATLATSVASRGAPVASAAAAPRVSASASGNSSTPSRAGPSRGPSRGKVQ